MPLDLKNKPLVLLAAIVVIIFIALIIFYSRGDIGQGPSSGVYSPTWEKAPANIEVPEKESVAQNDNIAIPVTVAEDNKSSENREVINQTRIFEINAENDKFFPNTVIAYQGDRVHIKITALDKDYDFYQPDYGARQIIPQGETKPTIFRVGESGEFNFFCETCGGLESSAVGYIIVKPNESRS